MAVSLRGGTLDFDGVVEARAYFQHVTTGEGTGLRIEAEPAGIPLVIHIPGVPEPGVAPLGRWSSRVNHQRLDTIPIFIGRTFSFAFGASPAMSVGAYAGLSGIIQLDTVRLPEYREFEDLGRLRGSLEARAVADSLSVAPGMPAGQDTISITVEFSVEAFGLHDGRASAVFADGTPGGRSAPALIGGGNTYHRDGFPSADPQLAAIFVGEFADPRDTVLIWFGTKMTGPGQVAIQPFEIDSILRIRAWPDHFVAGMIGGYAGRPFVAVSGTLELDVFEAYQYPRWGVAQGRLVVELNVRNDVGGLDRTAAVIPFNVPSFWIVSVESGPPPPPQALRLLP